MKRMLALFLSLLLLFSACALAEEEAETEEKVVGFALSNVEIDRDGRNVFLADGLELGLELASAGETPAARVHLDGYDGEMFSLVLAYVDGQILLRIESISGESATYALTPAKLAELLNAALDSAAPGAAPEAPAAPKPEIDEAFVLNVVRLLEGARDILADCYVQDEPMTLEIYGEDYNFTGVEIDEEHGAQLIQLLSDLGLADLSGLLDSADGAPLGIDAGHLVSENSNLFFARVGADGEEESRWNGIYVGMIDGSFDIDHIRELDGEIVDRDLLSFTRTDEYADTSWIPTDAADAVPLTDMEFDEVRKTIVEGFDPMINDVVRGVLDVLLGNAVYA